MPKHIILLIGLIAVYGFLEIGTLVFTKSKFRVAGRDVTYYAVMIPGIVSLIVPLMTMIFQTSYSRFFYWAGVVLMVCGIFIRIKGVMELAGNFSNVVEKREGQVLVSRGLHSIIRHPAYLGTILISFSVIVALQARWWQFVFPVLTIAGVLWRIWKEEKFLAENLAGYREYMKKTQKLIPWIF